MSNIAPAQQIERLIRLIRSHRVMLDADLADLYGVETRVLIQAVKRNTRRFPADFMFQLSVEETKFLSSQSVISKTRRGGTSLGINLELLNLEPVYCSMCLRLDQGEAVERLELRP